VRRLVDIRLGLCLAVGLAAVLAGATVAQAVDQEPKNGCTSPQPYSGSLTSPPFSPGAQGEPVAFQSWFEVESVAPDTFDLTVLEYSANQGPWTEFGRLNPSEPLDPAGAPDQPFSNNGLNAAPSFQRYSFTLPVGDGPVVRVRFRFDTGDDTFQGFRGVAIDEVVLPTFQTVQGFEQGLGNWTIDAASAPSGPSWQVLTNPESVSVKSPEINPELVTLPDFGALPAAAAGQRVAWFGNVDSGTFCGPDFANRTQQPDTTPPDTPILSGPPAFGNDPTPTFTFSSTEPGSTFLCSLDGGPFEPCFSPFTTPRLAGGRHTFAVQAVDAAGNPDPTPTVYVFEVAVQLDELDRPTRGRDVNVGPVPGSGPVFIAVPRRGSAAKGSARASQKGLRFVPLREARKVPVGSFLNTRRGAVQLLSARSARRVQSGFFSRGLFQVLQSRKRSARGMTELRLKGSSFNRCRTGRRGRRGSASAAQLSRRTVRRLRSNARGRFRTRGRHSAATVRGTVWITADRCDGTLTTVRRGRVAVRDFRRKRTITVRRGKSYLSRAPR